MVFRGCRDGHRLQADKYFDISVLKIIGDVKRDNSSPMTPFTERFACENGVGGAEVGAMVRGGGDPLPLTNTMKHLFEDQIVCLMGFPCNNSVNNNQMNILWGRVLKFDQYEVLITAFSEGGNSGGPLFDGAGNLVGILSKGYNHIDRSIVTPITSEFLKYLREQLLANL